jgi:hypothetical protein
VHPTSILILILEAACSSAWGAPKAVIPSLPAIFEPNLGQASSEVRFLSRGAKQTLLFQDDTVVVSLPESQERISIQPLGITSRPRLRGMNRLAGMSNYLKGEPDQWITDVPQFDRVRYENLYPGIDAVFYGLDGRLEFDLLVLPRANPKTIRFHVSGVEKMRRSREGELVLSTASNEVKLGKPFAYQQDEAGQHPVSCSFTVGPDDTFGFAVGEYDRSRALVIDPSLFSTYLGGKGSDIPAAVTTDSTGNIYVTGFTSSTDFPVSGSNYKGTLTAGDADAFVVKLNPTATSVIYATYLGGSFADYAKAIAIDSAGAAYITGATIGRYPTTAGAFRETPTDAPAIFATKLNSAGNGLVYSTYLDGAGSGQAMALDTAGNAYIAGYTYSAGFTTTAGAYQRTYGGATDAFVVKLNSTGTAQVFSTFLGGSAEEQAMSLKVDSTGAAFVAGFTNSSNFPTSVGAYRTSYSGSTDAFVTKLSPTGAAIQYSTLLGGPNADRAYGVDVSASGEAYVAGQTFSASFPTTAGAFRTAHGGGSDAFVTKLNSAGTALVYSTFLGADGTCSVSDSFRLYQCDSAYAIAVDGGGLASVVGLAGSGFQVAGAAQSTPGGNGDAFLTQLNATGTALVESTFIGGNSGDVALGFAKSTASGPVVVGLTASTNLPGTTGALQPAHSGGLDGFVTRIGTCPVTVGTTSSFFPATAGSYQLAVITDANCGWQATSDVSWVAINPASGTGNGSISYTLEANSGPLRVGHVTVNGATLTLQQVSGACLHLNSPGSWFPDAGGPFMLNVFATCPWTASSNRSWIYLDNTAGSGNGSILYYIYPNLTGAARFGEINVS